MLRRGAIALLDEDRNCDINGGEAHRYLRARLTLDIDLDGDQVMDALSVGFQLSAVPATFLVAPP